MQVPRSELFASFPKTLTALSKEFRYTNQEDATAIIEELAGRLATIFAGYLTLEGHNPLSKRTPTQYPPKDEVETFRTNLKKRIISVLSTPPRFGNTMDLHLTNDLRPERDLLAALKESNITDATHKDYLNYFPTKALVWVLHRPSDQLIKVNMAEK